ncbi:MAG: SgcJ/EcaC family oxidoreductase [Bdellovibrionales bacterium]|nr:SgcJ/EcaC family oxidoreductase [Bdellovibrionales bacterium]
MTTKFADEEKVLNLYKELLNQWNEKQGQGMANLFTDDGSMVGFDGSQVNTLKDIEAHLTPIFAQYPTARFIHIVREVRQLAADTAMVRANVGMVPRGYSDINPAVNAVQTMIAVKKGGDWKVAMFQNTPAAYHGRPEEAEKLTTELRAVLDKQIHTN